jgi:hypothetical protein
LKRSSLVGVIDVRAVRRALIVDEPAAALPGERGVLTAGGGLGDHDVVVRPTADREMGLVEGDELADELGGVGRERRQERLLPWLELRRC